MRFLAAFVLVVAPVFSYQAATAAIWVPNDHDSIAVALQAASYGDTVFVAAGTYYEHDIVMTNGVALQSESGPEVTVIDAQQLGRVVYCEGLDSTTTIMGFTISGGMSAAGDGGGGILCVQASPRIVGNILTGNRDGAGGAICCDQGSSARIEGNRIHSNQADFWGGAIYSSYSTTLVVENRIESNDAASDGGGIYCWNDSSSIVNNVIAGNSCLGERKGGGIFCYRGSLEIESNTIISNEAGWGGGGGIACEYSDATIRGNTICYNFGDYYGGGVHLFGSGALLDRNIIAFNGTGVYCSGGLPAPTFTCCDIFNATNFSGDCGKMIGVDGNFSEDPLFCDPENDDFTLDGCSPCLPGNHPQGWDCGLNGALGEGCSTASVVEHTESWSTIKALFR